MAHRQEETKEVFFVNGSAKHLQYFSSHPYATHDWHSSTNWVVVQGLNCMAKAFVLGQAVVETEANETGPTRATTLLLNCIFKKRLRIHGINFIRGWLKKFKDFMPKFWDVDCLENPRQPTIHPATAADALYASVSMQQNDELGRRSTEVFPKSQNYWVGWDSWLFHHQKTFLIGFLTLGFFPTMVLLVSKNGLFPVNHPIKHNWTSNTPSRCHQKS